MAHGAEELDKHAGSRTTKVGFLLGPAIWMLILGVAAGTSVFFGLPKWLTTNVILAALCAASVTLYFVTCTYCLTRLPHALGSGWLLYSFGFGLFLVSSLVSVAMLVTPQSEHFHTKMDLLETILLLAGSIIIMLAGRIARAGAIGQRSTVWKTYARVALGLTLLIIAWRVGIVSSISDMMCRVSEGSNLLTNILIIAVLGSYLVREQKVSQAECDEMSHPLMYWMTAMLIGCIMTCLWWQHNQDVILQVKAVQVLAVAGFVTALISANERRQREGKIKMRDLDTMQKISWSLIGAATRYDLCAAFAAAISEGLKDTPVVIYLAEKDNLDLTIVAVAGFDDPTIEIGKKCSLRPERRPGFHNGHTARAFASGSIETTSEVFSDTEFLPWKYVARHDGLAVSVPLPYQDRIIGVVNIFLPGATSLGEGRKRLLQSAAAAVAPTIENAHLQIDEPVELELAA